MITGKNTTIRRIKESDLEALLEQLNDIDSQGEFLPVSITSHAKMLAQFHDNGFITEDSQQLLITDQSDQMLGLIWSFKSVPYYDAIEIGYQIFDHHNRGRGFASQAVSVFVRYLFETKPVNRLELRIAVDNIASLKIAEKTGFKREGINKEAAFSKGKRHDMVIFALLRSEWS